MPGSNGVPVATFVRLLVLDRDREANAVCVCVWLPRCYPASWSGASCCYEATVMNQHNLLLCHCVIPPATRTNASAA
eukprot:COSAG06_NODE_38093_length_427_cov_1.240854_1_plen_76_part_10